MVLRRPSRLNTGRLSKYMKRWAKVPDLDQGAGVPIGAMVICRNILQMFSLDNVDDVAETVSYKLLRSRLYYRGGLQTAY
jgi:hypothetical protein